MNEVFVTNGGTKRVNKSLRARRFLLFLVFVVVLVVLSSKPSLLLALYAPTGELHSHILPIPFVFAYLIYIHREQLPPQTRGSAIASLPLLVIGLALSGAAFGFSHFSATASSSEHLALVCFSGAGGPGNERTLVKAVPKVVGGYTSPCLERAVALDRRTVDTAVLLSSWRVAETTKLFANIFRSVNIAFGGRCIPIDPFYLTWKARESGPNTRFIELAGEINTSMPEPVAHRPAEALNSQRKLLNSSRILILGLARKPNVDDERESPSYVLMNLLSERGATVKYHDPCVPVIGTTREHSQRARNESVAWDEATLPSFALVLIATNHACVNYRELADWVPLIVDTRNAMATALSMKIAASANA